MLGRLLSTVLLLGACALTLAPVSEAGCQSLEDKVRNDYLALVRLPRAGESPSDHGPVYAQGTVPTCWNADDVVRYAGDALPFLPSSLRFRMENELSEKDLDYIKRCIGDVTGVACSKSLYVNGELTLCLAYDERVKIMGLYRRFVDANEASWLYEGPLYEGPAVVRTERKLRTGIRARKFSRAKETQPVENVPEFANLRDLACYIISAMPYCPETLSVSFTGWAKSKEDVERQKAVLLLATRAYSKGLVGPRGTVGCTLRQAVSSRGEATLRLTFSYGEHALLYAAHRGLIDPQRLSDMQRQGLGLITQLADYICEHYTTPYQRALAAHDALVLTCRYKKHPHENLVSDMLINQRGQCAHYAAVYNLLLNIMDMECIKIYGDSIKCKVSHVWNLVYLDGVWAQVDATWDDDRERKSTYLSHDHFFMTDVQRYLGVHVVAKLEADGLNPEENVEQFESLAAGCEWEKLDFPQCTDKSLDYETRFAKCCNTVDEMVGELVSRLSATGTPVLLEATVKELEDHFEMDEEGELDAKLVRQLMEKPERAAKLVHQALMKRGCLAKPVVDCSVSGKVTLLCE